jgi:glucose-1-phosphate adenylyltransferase
VRPQWQHGSAAWWRVVTRSPGPLRRADYYETLEECELLPGCLPMGIGSGSVISKCIVDKNARIGPNCQIVNKDSVVEANREEEGFVIKDGIVVIIKDSLIPAGTVI